MILALLLLAQAQVNTNVARPANGADGLFGVDGTRGSDEVELQLGFDAQWLPVRTGARVRFRENGWLQLSGKLSERDFFFALLPVVAHQTGDVLEDFSVGDIRLGVRRSLLRGDPFDVMVVLALELPTAHEGSMAGDDRLVVEPSIALGRILPRWNGELEVLGNALLRFRPPRDLGAVHPGTMLGLRAGAAWSPKPFSWFRRVFAETELGASFRDFAQETLPLEWRAGATLCATSTLAVEAVLGTRLDAGLGSPNARAAVSLRYAPTLCTPKVEKQRESDEDILAALARDREIRDRLAQEAAARQRLVLLAESEKAARDTARDLELLDLLAASEADALARANALALDDTRDTDGDGVPDRLDNCPREKGTAENHGCPRKQLVALREDRLEILEKIYFSSARARIEPRSWKLLDQVAQVLKSHPDLLSIQIEGYTDDRGSATTNTALSQARAEAVVNYLRKKGIAENRLAARGFGPESPIASNTSKKGREKNRRVEFRVLKRGSAAPPQR